MMSTNIKMCLILGLIIGILGATANAQECDPLKELQKQSDATLSVAAWSSLGLVKSPSGSWLDNLHAF
ncbi:hypothetical protein Ndes2526B_g04110 [Nannochloris sp. 'desiccata']